MNDVAVLPLKAFKVIYPSFSRMPRSIYSIHPTKMIKSIIPLNGHVYTYPHHFEYTYNQGPILDGA